MTILLVLLCVLYSGVGLLIPERVVVVDRNTKLKNYFVRGNLAIQNDQFQIEVLRNRLTEVTGLKKYKLIVISMLNFLTPKETKNRYIQQNYFEEHPQAGQYRNTLILGSFIDPFSLPKSLKPIITAVNEYISDIDTVDELITSIHQEINGGEEKKIIFLHCSAGMDRTGYVSGAYKLKYLEGNLAKIIQENSRFGGDRKQMHMNALNGLKWSCLKYKDEKSCTKNIQ